MNAFLTFDTAKWAPGREHPACFFERWRSTTAATATTTTTILLCCYGNIWMTVLKQTWCTRMIVGNLQPWRNCTSITFNSSNLQINDVLTTWLLKLAMRHRSVTFVTIKHTYTHTHTVFVTVQRHASTLYSIVVHLSQVNVHHTTPQPFHGPFSGTTRVRRCRKRTSGLYGANED